MHIDHLVNRHNKTYGENIIISTSKEPNNIRGILISIIYIYINWLLGRKNKTLWKIPNVNSIFSYSISKWNFVELCAKKDGKSYLPFT